jgi:hypothetical protein
MIPLSKCKEVNNAPNIIIHSGERWTHGAQHNGMKHKGLEYLYFETDLELYNKARMFGGKDFWDKDDCYNAKHFKEREKDIRKWVDTEERKVYAKINNSIMGR